MCAVSVLWQQPVQADTAATLSSNSPSPVVRIYPRYPIQAAQERIEGMVQLRFNVEADGSTSQIEVILSQPEGVFEKEAIRALAQWRYQPAADELPNQGVKVQLDFVLD
jgi:TonB family protein